MESLLRAVITVLAVAVCVMSAYGIHRPRRLVAHVRPVWRQRYGIYLAVILRLLLGVSLVLAAPGTRFQIALQAIGWLAIGAAVVIPLLGRGRIERLMTWLERRPPLLVRAWCVAGVAFGAFLLYAIW